MEVNGQLHALAAVPQGKVSLVPISGCDSKKRNTCPIRDHLQIKDPE